MSIALDFGQYQIRSLRRKDKTLVSRHVRAVYSVLSDSPERRKMLEKVNIPYAVSERELLIIGDAAAEYSQMFQVPCVPLFPNGQVPTDDPPARQILGAVVDSLLPEPSEKNEKCGMTIPSSSASKSVGVIDDTTRFLFQLVQLRGYEPVIVSAGMAVVLAELVGNSFTGIGMSIGAGSCDVSLAHHGVEIARCTVPRGGDWIDEQMAHQWKNYSWDVTGNQYLDTDNVSRWKQGFKGSVMEPNNVQEQLLSNLYSELLVHVIQEVSTALSSERRVQNSPSPLSLVCSGGMTRITGFEKLLQNQLLKTPLPVDIDDVRISTRSNHTIARGCLIQAELESEPSTSTLRSVA